MFSFPSRPGVGCIGSGSIKKLYLREEEREEGSALQFHYGGGHSCCLEEEAAAGLSRSWPSEIPTLVWYLQAKQRASTYLYYSMSCSILLRLTYLRPKKLLRLKTEPT